MTDVDEFGTEFPHGIGRVAKRELAANGFVRYDQLTGISRRELLAIHGIGPKAVRILDEELARQGRAFAED
jgi:predicted flap endonuclease-1-like 5' DNA nuclease